MTTVTTTAKEDSSTGASLQLSLEQHQEHSRGGSDHLRLKYIPCVEPRRPRRGKANTSKGEGGTEQEIEVLRNLLLASKDENTTLRKELEDTKRALEMKRMFVRYVSHEIRTPLNTVSMGLKLMQESEAARALNVTAVAAQRRGRKENRKAAKISSRNETAVGSILLGGGGVNRNTMGTSHTTTRLQQRANAMILEEEASPSDHRHNLNLHADSPQGGGGGADLLLAPSSFSSPKGSLMRLPVLADSLSTPPAALTPSRFLCRRDSDIFSHHKKVLDTCSSRGSGLHIIETMGEEQGARGGSSRDESMIRRCIDGCGGSSNSGDTGGQPLATPPSVCSGSTSPGGNTAFLSYDHEEEEDVDEGRDGGEDMTLMAEDIKESCDIAISIVNDLLLYEKLEGGILQLEIQEEAALLSIAEAVKTFGIQARQAQLDLQLTFDSFDFSADELTDPTIFIEVDKPKLSQVIRNLVSNAIKFSPPESIVAVHITLRQELRGGSTGEERTSSPPASLAGVGVGGVPTNRKKVKKASYVRVTVHDSGPGISLENQKKLFTSIVQFDANKLQGGGGSGLGLYISKGIMDLHGGSIGLFSEGGGKGTSFYIDIPVKRIREGRFMNDDGDLLPLSPSARLAHSALAASMVECGEMSKMAATDHSASPKRILLVKLQSIGRKMYEKTQKLVVAARTIPHPPRVPHGSAFSSPLQQFAAAGGGAPLSSILSGARFSSLRAVAARANRSSGGSGGSSGGRGERGGAAAGSSSSPSQTVTVDRHHTKVAEGEVRNSEEGVSEEVCAEDAPPAHGGVGGGVWTPRWCNSLQSSCVSSRRGSLTSSTSFTPHVLLGGATPNSASASLTSTSGGGGGGRSNDTTHACTGGNANELSSCSSSLPPVILSVPAQSEMKVLIVDDSRLNRKMAVRLLKSKKICKNPDEAVNGKDALDKVVASLAVPHTGDDPRCAPPPQLQYMAILMDYVMPVMDGPTATARIREAGFKGLIIGITGNVRQEEVAQFASQGADLVMGKPLDVDRLSDLLRNELAALQSGTGGRRSCSVTFGSSSNTSSCSSAASYAPGGAKSGAGSMVNRYSTIAEEVLTDDYESSLAGGSGGEFLSPPLSSNAAADAAAFLNPSPDKTAANADANRSSSGSPVKSLLSSPPPRSATPAAEAAVLALSRQSSSRSSLSSNVRGLSSHVRGLSPRGGGGGEEEGSGDGKWLQHLHNNGVIVGDVDPQQKVGGDDDDEVGKVGGELPLDGYQGNSGNLPSRDAMLPEEHATVVGAAAESFVRMRAPCCSVSPRNTLLSYADGRAAAAPAAPSRRRMLVGDATTGSPLEDGDGKENDDGDGKAGEDDNVAAHEFAGYTHADTPGSVPSIPLLTPEYMNLDSYVASFSGSMARAYSFHRESGVNDNRGAVHATAGTASSKSAMKTDNGSNDKLPPLPSSSSSMFFLLSRFFSCCFDSSSNSNNQNNNKRSGGSRGVGTACEPHRPPATATATVLKRFSLGVDGRRGSLFSLGQETSSAGRHTCAGNKVHPTPAAAAALLNNALQLQQKEHRGTHRAGRILPSGGTGESGFSGTPQSQHKLPPGVSGSGTGTASASKPGTGHVSRRRVSGRLPPGAVILRQEVSSLALRRNSSRATPGSFRDNSYRGIRLVGVVPPAAAPVLTY